MAQEINIGVRTTGANGSASGEALTPDISGFLHMIAVNFDGAPGTTTVTIEEEDGAGRVFLDLAAGNTDAVYYPSVALSDEDGALTDSLAVPYIHSRGLRITVENSNALNPAVRLIILLV